MRNNFVLTFTGPDRIGIVENLTRLIFERGGNVENSRMARLGGEFAVLMLVSMPAENYDPLSSDLESLASQGHKVTLTPTEPPYEETPEGLVTYHIEVEGADHEGIIHSVSRYLSERGVNIESMDTKTTSAPTTGSPLFSMTARVVAPASVKYLELKEGLNKIGDSFNLTIELSEAEDQA